MGGDAGRKAVCQSSDPMGLRLQFSQVLCDTKGKQKARLPHPLPLPLPLQPARWADRLGGEGGREKGQIVQRKTEETERCQETGNGERQGEMRGKGDLVILQLRNLGGA